MYIDLFQVDVRISPGTHASEDAGMSNYYYQNNLAPNKVLFLPDIKKTRLLKYIENFTTKD